MTKNLNEKVTPDEQVRTADIYLAAYLLLSGSVVTDLEVINELGKDLCFFTFKGKSALSNVKAYHESKASVDPALYQKALNRIRDIIAKSVKEVKTSSVKGGNS